MLQKACEKDIYRVAAFECFFDIRYVTYPKIEQTHFKVRFKCRHMMNTSHVFGAYHGTKHGPCYMVPPDTTLSRKTVSTIPFLCIFI